MCVDTACAPMPPKPHAGLSLFQGKFSRKVKNSKSQKVFDFSIFFVFSTFRAEISWNGNFSTFRLFAVENRDFHGVTATSQKSTQSVGKPPNMYSNTRKDRL